ncbi:MAG: hypothetical protein AAFX87_00620 [Bacteroidota bacterium]
MDLKEACKSILDQIDDVIDQIREVDYSKEVDILNATIGQHIRHTLEFFICLKDGYQAGAVNYDKRTRDKRIEESREFTRSTIEDIKQFITFDAVDRELVLIANYSQAEGKDVVVSTTFQRELAYNIEHAVHHMAIMKIGINAVAPYVQLPKEFGIAVSTLRFQDSH